MQRGTVVFLVLMICSALIIGTTLGIISTRQYLIPHLAAAKSGTPQELGESTASEPAEFPSAPVPTNSGNNGKNASHANPSRHRQPETQGSLRLNSDFAPANLLLLTENEIREIKSMLRNLGYETSDLSEAVKQFQQKNHLTATGYLDTETLTSIITQVLRQKVATLTP